MVRPLHFSEDGSSVVISLCRIGNGNDCSTPVTAGVPPPVYRKLRSSGDLTSCLAVCMDAAGSTCQPSSFDVSQQRLVIFQQGCDMSSPGDGSQVWFWDGLLLRNQLTGWCLDPALAANQTDPGLLVVRPCLSNGDNGGDSPVNQMWLWGAPNGTAISLPEQSPSYFGPTELDRLMSRWMKASSNTCPTICGAACSQSMPNGGSSKVFAVDVAGSDSCSDLAAAFSLGDSSVVHIPGASNAKTTVTTVPLSPPTLSLPQSPPTTVSGPKSPPKKPSASTPPAPAKHASSSSPRKMLRSSA